jgi:spermidine/putrescine transport system substrate-binding protein
MPQWSKLRKDLTAFGLMACFASAATAAHAQNTLNVLTWCDNVDAGLLKPFETANGVKINNKTYDGTGTALAVLKQSNPGDWDVLVVDSTDVKRVVSYGILAPLDPAGFPWDDIPKTLRNPAFHYVDGKLYAVPEKFGYNSIAYNKNKVDAKEMMDATAIWDPKYRGKVAIYDYYNAVIPQVAIGLGYDPDNVTEAEFPAIKAKLLLMKQNARLVGDITTVQTALATGDVDMVISGGEYVVAGLAHDKPNLDWVLPSKGGLRWEQAIGILADSKKKALANKFLHYILTPDAQGKLATSSCYWGMPVNMKATLTADQKKILRWDQQPGFIAHSFPFPQPSSQLDKEEQDLWAETIQK